MLQLACTVLPCLFHPTLLEGVPSERHPTKQDPSRTLVTIPDLHSVPTVSVKEAWHHMNNVSSRLQELTEVKKCYCTVRLAPLLKV